MNLYNQLNTLANRLDDELRFCGLGKSVLGIDEAEPTLKSFKADLNLGVAERFWAKGKKYLYNIRCDVTLAEPVVEATPI